MVTETRAATIKRLNEILDTWQSWPARLNERPSLIRQLGGNSNATFLVSTADGLLVVRLNAAQEMKGVNRIAERWILEQPFLNDIQPRLIFWHETFMISEFVKGEQFDINIHSQALPEIARQFHRIHGTPKPAFPKLDPFQHLIHYLTHPLIPDTKLLGTCVEMVKRNSPLSPQYRVCHNDLNPENILVTEAGLSFLDWEYANITPIEFDIAVFASTLKLTQKQMAVFIACYAGELDLEAIRSYQRLYKLLEILWWHIKTAEPAPIDLALEKLLAES
jgi:thiamine kinase-like enzyme